MAGRVYRESGVVPGDLALVEDLLGTPLVTGVRPRHGVLERHAHGGRRRVVAANVDLVMVVVSLREPPVSTVFVDRALVACEWAELAATVVLNKIDLAEGDDAGLIERLGSAYGSGGAGYGLHAISCETGEGVERLAGSIAGRTVVMTGPSGAGKTSIARCFVPGLDLAVGEVSPGTGRGRHTTVSARLVPLGGGAMLMDTPGLGLFGTDHVPRDMVAACMPELAALAGSCRFRNCLHLAEPGCAVKAAVSAGELPASRYGSYRDIMEAGEG